MSGIVFLLTIILTSILKLWTAFIKLLFTTLFDKASSPTTSPFSYFSALIGLSILAAKLAQEIINHFMV
jgi:hypothetical protein